MNPEQASLMTIQAVADLLDREVWIITARAGDRRGGLVATWVSWASIDPQLPQILISLAASHYTAELVDTSGAFAAHLITQGEADHAWNFAIGSGRDRDKLAGVPLRFVDGEVPVLRDCLAWMECRVFKRLDAGDRRFYWADVVWAEQVGKGVPLRQRQFLERATAEQRQQLEADRKRDLELLRPLHLSWRSST